MRRAQKGDRFAFGELVERHQQRMLTLAARVLGRGRADEAADAVQDAFVRAWLTLPRFRGDALFSTWLYRICLNAAHDVRTKRRPEPVSDLPEPADPRDELLASELSSELQRALDALAEDYRVAVVLYDVLGCSYAEIADLTEVAEGTVKSRIFRGRSELAKLLGTVGAPTESNR